MKVQFLLNKLDSSRLTTMHLVFPQSSPPFNSTKILKVNKETPFTVKGTIIFAIVHVYSSDALLHRFMFVPKFNVDHRVHNLTYNISVKGINNNPVVLVSQPIADLQAVQSDLQNYITKQYNLIESLSPEPEIIRRKHSLFWELDLNNSTFKIPYVTLAMKGNKLLQNVTLQKDLPAMRNFFVKELYAFMKQDGKTATDFTSQSYKAYGDSTHKHAVYITIANFFSQLIHKNVTYKTDYNATGKMDYVGMNLINDQLIADCEDQATAAYNIIRLFRTIFPHSPPTPSLTLPFHFSAWLNIADVAIFQGSVEPHRGQPQINHIWCALLPQDCPFVFVEGTAEAADISKYKTLIHAWMYKNAPTPELFDLFFINPHNNTYGLPIADLVYEKNAYQVFQAWGRNMMDQAYIKNIMFASNIATETFSIFDKVV